MLPVIQMAEKEMTSGSDNGAKILISGKTKTYVDTLQVAKLV